VKIFGSACQVRGLIWKLRVTHLTILSNKLSSSPYELRYQLAGFFLTLSILFAGSHVYASEICFTLFLILCLSKFKFNPLVAVIGLSCLCLYTLFSIGSDRTLNEMVFVILLLVLPCLGLTPNSLNIDSLIKGITVGLLISTTYALFLLAMQVIFPMIAQYLELCLYGERTVNSCGIPPYTIGGFPLQRLYGFASEPSTYGRTHVVLLALVMSNPRVKLSSVFIVIQIIGILATISITAMALLVVMFIVMSLKREKYNYGSKKLSSRKKWTIGISIAAILMGLFITVDGIFDAVFSRTYDRIVDLFLGEDTSAFKRSTATWSPVLSFFTNGSISEVLFGMGVNQYLLFLEGFSTFTIVDGTLVEFAGQPGSILSILLGGYGLVSVVGFLAMLFLLDRYRLTVVACCVFGFLVFHTSALSFSTLALIYVVGVNRASIPNVK